MTTLLPAASPTRFHFHGRRGPRDAAAVRRRHDPIALLEQLESRVLLTSTGALEVWAGNDNLTANPDSFFSIDQSDYTQLGVTSTPNSSFMVDTGGVQYNYFVIVSRGQVQINSVEGSDSTFLAGLDFSGNLTQNGNVATLGTQVNDNGTFAGYAEFANPDSWTSLTVQTGSMGVMLEGQVSVESDYLPGAANPYNLSGEMRLNDNGLITSGEVRTPAGIWYPLTMNNDSGNSNEQWRFGENFSSLANLTTVMPSGIYTFVVNSPLGTTTTQFSYTQSSLTPVPGLIGLVDGATGISTSKTFNWNPITDANPNDNLNLEIDGPDNSNNSIVNQQLDTSATTSGPVTLDANSNYSLELSLNSFTQSTNADGFNFNTDTSNETDLLFTTSATVIPPALTITSVGFPDGTIQPGDWLDLPISGGNSGGNAIGKSGGVAVPIQYEVVLSTTKTFGPGNIIIGTGTIGGGSGGGSIGGESFGGGGPIVQIPTGIAPGSYWVGLKGDSTNVVSNNEDVPTSAFSATQITISPSGTIAVTPPASQNATTGHSQMISLGSFTAANTTTPYTVDVNWRDGSADTIFAVAGTGAIPATAHTYAANGNNTVTLTVDDWDGEAEQSSTFHVTVTGPTKLAFGQQPSNATAGLANTPDITVDVLDQFGNIATTDNSTVTLTINSGPQSGTLTIAAVNGVATFTDTALDVAGTYTLKATDGLLTSATSHSFTIAPADPAQLVFGQQPGNVTTNHPDSPAITVKVEDQFGNLVTTDTSDVTLSINSGPGALSGTLTVAAIGGIATFSDVNLDTAGTYTLQAADPSLTATTSHSFIVSTAADNAPTLTAMKPFATAIGGQPFAITYNQLVNNATGLGDIDNDTLDFQVDAPVAGATFKLDNVTQNSFPFLIAPGQTLNFTPAFNASGKVNAFSVRAFDGTLTSAKDIPVIITTNPEPIVSIVTTSGTATDVNNGVKGLGVLTVSRTGPTTFPLTVDYDVQDNSGSVNDGTNYNTLSGTVTIPAGKPSATVSIVPIDNIARDGNLIVTLNISGDDPNYLLGPKASAAVTITDNNLAPFSVAGKSLTGTITAGAAPFPAAGAYQLFFNASDNTFVFIGGPTLDATQGTYSYTRTGAATATLDFTGVNGTSDGTVTFSSATAAVFSFAQEIGAGHQTSKVTLVAAPKTSFAPIAVAGHVDTHNITTINGVHATGSDQVIFDQSTASSMFVVVGVAPLASSINNYTYEKFGPNLGIVTFTNAAGDNGFTTVLYTSATKATYVTTITAGAAAGAFQHGSLTVSPPPRAPLAPLTISGKTLTNTISGGAAPFALKGTSTMVLAATSYSFNQTTPIAASTGTYTYEALTPTIGLITFDDSAIGPSFDVLTFTSASKATYVLANPATAGWQRGKSTLI